MSNTDNAPPSNRSPSSRLFQRKPRIMLVDDEPSNIRVLSDALRHDYDLIIATHAAKALEILDNGQVPHLMLLDIMMPDIDGFDLCRTLKAHQEFRHIPVIFITALIDNTSEEQGYEVGAVDYIHKPIRIPSVRARVRTHISLNGMLDHMIELNMELSDRVKQVEQLNLRLQQEQAERDSAEASRKLFEQVFMATSEGIAVLDPDGRVTAVNGSFTRITGYPSQEVIGQRLRQLGAGTRQDTEVDEILRQLESRDYWSGEIYNRRRNGELYPELRTVSAIRGEDGQVSHYVTVFNDVTNLRETEKRLEELTWRDPVTQLPNRSLFLDQLGTVLKFCHHGEVATAVMVIDINNFRYINETFGFECGDWVIREFSRRLQSVVFDDDSVARLAGDEFGVVLAPKRWSLNEAYRVAMNLYERIRESLARPFHSGPISNHRIDITVGVALYPTESSHSPSLALRHAETAHRSAKRSERPLAVFEDAMSDAIREQLAIESDLDRAIEREEIILYAQPQFSPDHQLSSLEMLARWQHPQRGLLGPGTFIPFAEQTRQIVQLERYILRRALADLARIRSRYPDLGCAINISARHFAEDDFVQVLRDAIHASEVPAECLTFELTESVMVQDVDATIQKMQDLSQTGCAFSLDDFGTGYSSLSQLRRLPISEIKIDRSFVLAAPEESMAADIVEMIRRIGESMNLRVVAEGVETEAHARFLKQHHPGVYLQGYYLGLPRPLTTFLAES